MAEENLEIDAIKHLLEIEKEASALIDDAKIEAEKRVSKAKSQYNEEFKKEYDSLMQKLESQYNSNCEEINKKYQDEFEGYKESLKHKKLNKDDFFKMLDSLFFEGEE